jgi:hypothetical protein
MAKTHELFRALVSNANRLPVPSGQWPDGTGGSPVLPLPTSEFGIRQNLRVTRGILKEVVIRSLDRQPRFNLRHLCNLRINPIAAFRMKRAGTRAASPAR